MEKLKIYVIDMFEFIINVLMKCKLIRYLSNKISN